MRNRRWVYAVVALALTAVWWEFWRMTSRREEAPATVPPAADQVQSNATPSPALAAPPIEPKVLDPLAAIAPQAAEPVHVVSAAEEARLAALRAEFPYLPPLISLKVSDMPLLALANRLNGEVGGRIRPMVSSTNTSRYTLDLSEMPFGEVIEAIDAQHGIMINPSTNVDIIGGSDALPRRRVFCARGPFVMAAQVTYAASANPPYWGLTCEIAADPRITIGQVTYEAVLSPDDTGAAWLAGDINAPFWTETMRPSGTGLVRGERLVRPANPGTRFPKLSVKTQMLIETEKVVVDVEEADRKPGHVVRVGDCTVTIGSLAVVDTGGIRYQISMTPGDAKGPAGGVKVVAFKFFDSAGRTLGGGNLSNNSSGGFGGGGRPVTPPLRIRFEAAARTLRSDVNFEILNLPIPPLPANK